MGLFGLKIGLLDGTASTVLSLDLVYSGGYCNHDIGGSFRHNGIFSSNSFHVTICLNDRQYLVPMLSTNSFILADFL
jgi:hypothetical protein